MKFFKTQIKFSILVSLLIISQIYCKRRKLPFLNRLLPWIEEERFAQSLYLNSKISLLSLDTSSNTDFNGTIFNQVSNNDFSNVNQSSSASLCAIHLQSIIKRLWTNRYDISLLSLIDSFAKPAPGIRNGNLDWHGNQAQCESTSILLSLDNGLSSNFRGKYCRVEWNTQLTSEHSLSHYTGVCVPSSCNVEDSKYLKIFLEKFFFLKLSSSSHIIEISCKEEYESTETTAAFYYICIILLSLGILSTIYQRFMKQTINTLIKENSNDHKVSFLTSFSISEGLRSLSGENVSKNDILIIHYIRGLCAIILVLIHTGLDLMPLLSLNPEILLDSLPMAPEFWMLLRSIMAVFFFLTGFLINSNNDQNFNSFRSIFKAFIRLSPPYYFAILAQNTFASKSGLGSTLIFGPASIDRSQCSKFYPALFFYTYNYLPFDDMCQPMFWSMSVTFQLHVLSAFIVWLLLRSPLVGLITATLFIINEFVTSLQIFEELQLQYSLGLKGNFKSAENILGHESNWRSFYQNFYFQTITWLSPAMMGVIFTYFRPKIQGTSHHLQKKIVLMTSTLIITFYSLTPAVVINMHNYFTYSLLITVCPIIVGLILSLLIFIFHPQSSFIDYKLSFRTYPFLVHISKLSYSLYLIHGPVLTTVTNSIQISSAPDVFSVLSIFCGAFFIVYLASIFFYIFVEKPSQNIRKLLNL